MSDSPRSEPKAANQTTNSNMSFRQVAAMNIMAALVAAGQGGEEPHSADAAVKMADLLAKSLGDVVP